MSQSRSTAVTVLALSALALLAAPSTAQAPAELPPTSIMSVPVSPSVYATGVTRKAELVLLVLWRGAPGWYRVTPGQTSEGGGGRADGRITAWILRGAHSAEVVFDPAMLTATVQGRTISLPPGANVLLVDHVDRPDGGRLVKVLSIDPANVDLDPRRGLPAWAELLARSQELVDSCSAKRSPQIRGARCPAST
jgi:hypothetical protein